MVAMTSEEYARAYQDGIKLTFRFLLSRGVGPDSAEEISQAAWFRGWERLGCARQIGPRVGGSRSSRLARSGRTLHRRSARARMGSADRIPSPSRNHSASIIRRRPAGPVHSIDGHASQEKTP